MKTQEYDGRLWWPWRRNDDPIWVGHGGSSGWITWTGSATIDGVAMIWHLKKKKLIWRGLDEFDKKMDFSRG